jgi:hypothetical protein
MPLCERAARKSRPFFVIAWVMNFEDEGVLYEVTNYL